MAEEIVPCPACAKKFRIPDGAPPGSFPCTACGASVAYGGAAEAPEPAAGRKSKGGAQTSRGARRARARRSRGAAGGRRAAAEPEEAAGGGRRGRRGSREAGEKKENKTAPLLIAIGGFVLVAFIVVAALMSDDDPKPAETANGNGTQASSSALTSEVPDPPPVTPVEPTPPAPTPVPMPPAPPEPDEESGIGGTERRDSSKDYRHYFNRPLEELFVDLPPLDGTTDEEERALRADVAKFVDWDSARDGVDAEHRLEKAGRKAMPFLMSAFQFAYKGEKWTVDREKYAAYKIQQLARQICKADGPPSDFIARFGPGSTVPPEHYERAGRMWVAWWLGEGQYIKKFRGFDDEE